MLYQLIQALEFGFTGVMIESIWNLLGIYVNLTLSDVYDRSNNRFKCMVIKFLLAYTVIVFDRYLIRIGRNASKFEINVMQLLI